MLYSFVRINDFLSVFSESTTSREYAVPDVTKSTNSNTVGPLHPPPTPLIKPAFPQTLPKPLQKPPSERYYAATDVVKMPNLQGVSGNTVYAVPNVDLLSRDDSPVREIPRHRLHYMEKLGEGQFGEVNIISIMHKLYLNIKVQARYICLAAICFGFLLS